MINLIEVGRRAPVDVSTCGVFCSYGDNFPTAAPGEGTDDDRDHDAGAGSLVFTSVAEMTERGRPTDENIADLYRDVRAKLVFGVPVEELAAAKVERDKAAAGGVLASIHAAIAKGLEDDAATNEARAKGKIPEQVDAQQRFSKSFFTFKDQWEDFYRTVKDGSAFDTLSGNAVASTIDTFDDRYRGYLAGYVDLGFKPSVPPADKSGAGDTLPDVTGKSGKNVTDTIDTFVTALKWGLLAAVVVGGISLLSSARHVVAT